MVEELHLQHVPMSMKAHYPLQKLWQALNVLQAHPTQLLFIYLGQLIY
jgi:hypothetical protein